jgi:transposase
MHRFFSKPETLLRLHRGPLGDYLDQYADWLRGAILIQDNASYHKDSEVWSWFKSNRHWPEVHQLPPYSPELNPTERL